MLTSRHRYEEAGILGQKEKDAKKLQRILDADREGDSYPAFERNPPKLPKSF